jgi:hypothetical protein
MLFADEVFKAIEEEMRGYSLYSDINNVAKYSHITASDYPIITAFLDEYILLHTKISEQNLQNSPTKAFMYIISELKQFEELSSTRHKHNGFIEEKNGFEM